MTGKGKEYSYNSRLIVGGNIDISFGMMVHLYCQEATEANRQVISLAVLDRRLSARTISSTYDGHAKESFSSLCSVGEAIASF